MHITTENIGDILCLYETGKHIRVLEVNPQYVYYATEDGFHYATQEHYTDALPVTDVSRRTIFDENYMLGKTLNSAEYKAFVHMMSEPSSGSAKSDSVLSGIRAQQKHFSSRLASDRAQAVPGESLATKFLDLLSERSVGSHDTFWGHKVQLLSNWSYEYKIDGKIMDYASAITYLSNVHYIEPTRKPDLVDTINAANIRREQCSLPDMGHKKFIPER